jgi:hypothetical protein
MYDPADARKSYLQLFNERGFTSAIYSLCLLATWYMFNNLNNGNKLNTPSGIIAFLFFCIYFTWKPKLIRFLRGHLRGNEYRDKKD